MVDARSGTVLDKTLLRKGATGTIYWIPRIFSTARANLDRDIKRYQKKVADYTRRANACKPLDSKCIEVAILAQRTAYQATNLIQQGLSPCVNRGCRHGSA